ncbi:MAG: hypothetical protein ABIX11_14320, partial [Casimicrobiaceae bacterium]
MTMTAAVHVSLASTLTRAPQAAAPPPRPLLAAAGPCAILGGAAGADGLAIPVRPHAATLFG